ncbi:MAG: D-sedoheptulose-7-phosphate isomerase, partial [Candidatus Puniceispirillum sp.]
QAIAALITCYEREGKLLVCGNGGSAADAEHIVGEMMKGFCLPRRLSDNDKAQLASVAGDDADLLGTKLQYGLAALSLVSHSALITATANDQDGQLIFAQQVWGLGQAGDILVAISTSGNSQNVLLAAKTARAKNMLVIGLTGATGGKLAGLCDITICVPSDHVAQIQEMHLPIYHHICASVEAHFFA